jgi:MFS family permease
LQRAPQLRHRGREEPALTGAPETSDGRYTAIFATLALAIVAYSIMQTAVVAPLLSIQDEFHASSEAGAWLFSIYLLSAAVLTPIVGRLADMFGKKRMLVLSLFVYLLGLIICGLAPSMSVLLLGRAVQGASGAVLPLSFSIIRDTAPSERGARDIALVSASAFFGAGLGMIAGGPIADYLDFRYLFWLTMIPAGAALVAAVVVVPPSSIRSPGRVDLIGALLLTGGTVALLVALTEGHSWGWGSLRTTGLFIAAVVLLGLWAWESSVRRDPLVEMKMMLRRGVWTANLSTLFVGAGMAAWFLIPPTIAAAPVDEGGLGASPSTIALYMTPSFAANILAARFAGRLATRDAAPLSFFVGAAISAVSYAVFAAVPPSPWEICLVNAFMGLGLGTCFVSIGNLVVQAVPQAQTGVATGFNAVVRNIGGAVGVQVSAAIIVAGGTTAGAAAIASYAIAGIVACGVLTALAVPRARAAW